MVGVVWLLLLFVRVLLFCFLFCCFVVVVVWPTSGQTAGATGPAFVVGVAHVRCLCVQAKQGGAERWVRNVTEWERHDTKAQRHRFLPTTRTVVGNNRARDKGGWARAGTHNNTAKQPLPLGCRCPLVVVAHWLLLLFKLLLFKLLLLLLLLLVVAWFTCAGT